MLMRAWKRETPRKLTAKLASYLTATWVVRGLGLGILCKAGMWIFLCHATLPSRSASARVLRASDDLRTGC